jgi:hypothetical protein
MLHAARCMLHTEHQASDNVWLALNDAHSAVRVAPMMYVVHFLRCYQLLHILLMVIVDIPPTL